MSANCPCKTRARLAAAAGGADATREIEKFPAPRTPGGKHVGGPAIDRNVGRSFRTCRLVQRSRAAAGKRIGGPAIDRNVGRSLIQVPAGLSAIPSDGAARAGRRVRHVTGRGPRGPAGRGRPDAEGPGERLDRIDKNVARPSGDQQKARRQAAPAAGGRPTAARRMARNGCTVAGVNRPGRPPSRASSSGLPPSAGPIGIH